MLKINIFLPLAIEKADGAENDCKLCKTAFLTNLPPFIVSKFKNDPDSFLDYCNVKPAMQKPPKGEHSNKQLLHISERQQQGWGGLPPSDAAAVRNCARLPPHQMDHRQTCNKLKNKLTTCNMLFDTSLQTRGEIATTFITIISSLPSLQIRRVAVFELITVTRVIKGPLWIV